MELAYYLFPLLLLQAKAVSLNKKKGKRRNGSVSITSPSSEGGEDTLMGFVVGALTLVFPLLLLQAKAVSPDVILVYWDKLNKKSFHYFSFKRRR